MTNTQHNDGSLPSVIALINSNHSYIHSLKEATDHLTHACHGAALEAGWWIDTDTGEDVRSWPDKFYKLWVQAKLGLIITEVAEAIEGHRKDKMDDHLPQFKMYHVEIADAIIRALDLAGGESVPLAEIIVAKLQYNSKRADHKLENRVKEGGKSV